MISVVLPLPVGAQQTDDFSAPHMQFQLIQCPLGPYHLLRAVQVNNSSMISTFLHQLNTASFVKPSASISRRNAITLSHASWRRVVAINEVSSVT